MNEEVKTAFEDWLDSQPDETKTLIQERFSSLENSVKATRTERDGYSKELKELSKKLGKDNEATTHINELTAKLDKSEKKAAFIEDASNNGCKRPSVAYTIAEAEQFYTEDGLPDWDKIREAVPELFTAQSLNTDAGSGTNKKPLGDPNKAARTRLSNGTVRIRVK